MWSENAGRTEGQRMLFAIENSNASDAIVERVPCLSELPQFFSRIAQYRWEFIIYDDGFRGFTFSCIGFANSVREGERETFSLFEQTLVWCESRPG
jgi:hypothetical protein